MRLGVPTARVKRSFSQTHWLCWAAASLQYTTGEATHTIFISYTYHMQYLEYQMGRGVILHMFDMSY